MTQAATKGNVVPMRAERKPADISAEFKALAELAVARRAALPNIDAKMAWIEGQLDRVPKNGYNTEHKYHFVRESDLVDALRAILFEANVSLSFAPVPGSTHLEEFTSKSGGKGTDAFLDLKMVIRNGDEPYDKLEEVFPGQGRDWSDKAIPKAMTTAKKYAMILTFAMSSGDDVENTSRGDRDEKTDEPATPAPVDNDTVQRIGTLFTQLAFPLDRMQKACLWASDNRAQIVSGLSMREAVKLQAYLKKEAAKPKAAEPATPPAGNPTTAPSGQPTAIDAALEVLYCPECGAQTSPQGEAEPHAAGCPEDEDTF
jgi:hypothetical protein